MQELDIMLRRAKLKALVYRSLARRIAGLTVACSEEDRVYVEEIVSEEQAKLRQLADIHDPQQLLLTQDDH